MRLHASASIAAAVALCFALFSSASSAQTLRLASGEKGGTYHEVYAKNVVSVLKGRKVNVRTTTGSAENLDLLVGGEADLGFAQADVFALRMEEEPDVFGELEIVGHLAAECVFIAYRKEGPLTKWEQLSERVDDRRPEIALGPYGGGMGDSWNYLLTLVPGVSQAVPSNEGGAAALDKLVAGDFDAVGWVTSPDNVDHLMFQATRAREGLALLDLDDPALGGKLPDGKRVYSVREITLGKGAKALSVETVCTDAVMFATKSTNKKAVKILEGALDRIATGD